MNRSMDIPAATTAKPVTPSLLGRMARRLVLRQLAGLRTGRLVLREPGGTLSFGQAEANAEIRGEISVHSPSVYPQMLLGGTVGAGEAYMDGLMDTPDLTSLVRLFVINREIMGGLDESWLFLRKPLLWLDHARRANSRKGAKRNIAAHYDLGNEFFRLFLDREHMMYSSAIFPHPAATLEEASTAKLKRICDKLSLQPEHHVLEIGGGWGGFALYAARHHGCRVTTTTISAQQFRHAQAQVRAAGLEDRITVIQQDYRELSGRYDRIVSIEMIEAVGHKHLGTYFSQCGRLLKPGGLMMLQAITIADRFYEQARRNVDFIQRYIFPGGALPSLGVLAGKVAQNTALTMVDLYDIGAHYVETLRHWRERVQANRDAILAQGYPEQFLRMWHFYLCYCEGGFMERSISAVQMMLAGADWRAERERNRPIGAET